MQEENANDALATLSAVALDVKVTVETPVEVNAQAAIAASRLEMPTP